MEDQTEGEQWCIFGSTVQGASHKRKAKPNQDAIRWWPVGDAAIEGIQQIGSTPPVILAVADGHGGERYTRAQHGAKLAVECAVELFAEILTKSESQGVQSHSFLKDEAERRLPRDLVQRWQAAVDEHLAHEPAPDASEDPQRLYGTTLLVAAVTRDFVLCLQLGDGDIRIVSDDGDYYAPFLRDSELVGNETHSLALKDAWKYARVHFKPSAGRPPALILLATDGYSNSFASIEGFDQVGPDILRLLRTRGVAEVSTELGTWLDEASSLGSGDDVTAGVICRLASLIPTAAPESAPVQAADTPAPLRIEHPETDDLSASGVENPASDVLHEESEARQP